MQYYFCVKSYLLIQYLYVCSIGYRYNLFCECIFCTCNLFRRCNIFSGYYIFVNAIFFINVIFFVVAILIVVAVFFAVIYHL